MNSRSLTYKVEAIAQLCTPSYWLVRGRAAHVPLQRTTATIGSALAASFPRMVATLPITGAPPTGGHNRPVNVSAFTQAVAKLHRIRDIHNLRNWLQAIPPGLVRYGDLRILQLLGGGV